MSEWVVKPTAVALTRASSSISTALWPKSPPAPPKASGAVTQSKPSSPARSQRDLGTIPSRSHWA